MNKKHVPTLAALSWGFGELSSHLALLLPLSAVFFAPEFCAKAGWAWPLLFREAFKTAFFFVLLLRAMKLTKPAQTHAPKGSTRAFATGEILKMTAQALAFGLGAALLWAWLYWRDPALLQRLWQGGWDWASLQARAQMLEDAWRAEPLWAQGAELLLLGALPLEVHVLLNFFGYIVADRGLEAPQALRQAFGLARGVQLELWFFYALCVALNIIGFKLFIVGAIYTFPATVLATVYVYRALDQWREHA